VLDKYRLKGESYPLALSRTIRISRPE